MKEAAQSRKMLARRRLLGSAGSDEEARETLQSRLNLYCKAMFWSFVVLLVFLTLAYQYVFDEAKAPAHWTEVFIGSAVMLAVMAFLWRMIIPRRDLSIESLYRLDLLFAGAIGITFGACAAAQYDLQAASYTSLIFGAFNVFSRALLVPSSAQRTAVVSSVTFLPIIAGGIYLASRGDTELPPAALIGGGITIAGISVAIATQGSVIIYGLRQQVDEAMTLGMYKLDKIVGQGGMGTVYRAHHALLRRPTAIKLLQPDRVGVDNLDRFEREVRAMSTLTHPNTVAVFDYGHTLDGLFYYAMEYLDGINLEELVKRSGALPAGRVVHLVTQVCGALQEAHDAGLVHRDIKPGNIILCQRGGISDVAKVVDFGLVQNITDDANSSGPAILGTPAYIAPENVTNPELVGPSVDLYALGATAYFLITGRCVFAASTDAELVVKHITATPTPPSRLAAVPPALEAIILKCLAKAPRERYGSAAELAQALDAVPRDPTWSPREAATWWREFRTRPNPAISPDARTITVEVNLSKRSA